MANTTGTSGANPSSSGSLPQVSSNPLHNAFLLLLGQLVGVLVAMVVADTNEDVGTWLVAIFVILWLIWILNKTDVLTTWAAKVGLAPKGA